MKKIKVQWTDGRLEEFVEGDQVPRNELLRNIDNISYITLQVDGERMDYDEIDELKHIIRNLWNVEIW